MRAQEYGAKRASHIDMESVREFRSEGPAESDESSNTTSEPAPPDLITVCSFVGRWLLSSVALARCLLAGFLSARLSENERALACLLRLMAVSSVPDGCACAVYCQTSRLRTRMATWWR